MSSRDPAALNHMGITGDGVVTKGHWIGKQAPSPRPRPNHDAAPWIEPVDALLSSTDTRQEMQTTYSTCAVTVWSPLTGTSS